MDLTLEYQDKRYRVPQEEKCWSKFSWEEGTMSCDCQRSLHIQQHADKNFPEMECGNEIKLLTVIP